MLAAARLQRRAVGARPRSGAGAGAGGRGTGSGVSRARRGGLSGGVAWRRCVRSGPAEAPTDLGLRLDYRLQHILVDEFQDTSSAQLELVRLLTAGWQAGDGRSVFCVGDPMQSIYGFRQAEVRAFLELAEDGIGELRFDVQRLRDNFRSAKPLVDWINDCFSRILPRADDRDRGAIAFRPSRAARSAIGRIGRPPRRELCCAALPARAEESAAIADMIAAQARSGIPSGASPFWCARARTRARSRPLCASAASRFAPWISSRCRIAPSCATSSCWFARCCISATARRGWRCCVRPGRDITLADLLIISRGAPLVWERSSR